jgi:alcohol dehydrogenase class IV
MDGAGIPTLAKATGATSEDAQMLAEDALKSIWATPREITVDDLKLMFEKALSR